MASQEGPSQPKKRLTRYLDVMANEYPSIKRCLKNLNDHECKFHCSIRNYAKINSFKSFRYENTV